jgi:hypothetical protein
LECAQTFSPRCQVTTASLLTSIWPLGVLMFKKRNHLRLQMSCTSSRLVTRAPSSHALYLKANDNVEIYCIRWAGQVVIEASTQLGFGGYWNMNLVRWETWPLRMYGARMTVLSCGRGTTCEKIARLSGRHDRNQVIRLSRISSYVRTVGT